MEIDERIRALRAHTRLTQEQFAQRVGKTTQSISQWETPERPGQKRRPPRPSKASIEAMAREFDISANWLLTGDGSMLENRTPGEVTSVPRLPWVSAGDWWLPEQVMDGDPLPEIAVAGLPPGDWVAIQVDGSSMDRISPPGSIILINRREKQLAQNACYVIMDGDGRATYKRYRPAPDRFEPVTFTEGHETIFPEGPVTIFGRVRRSIIDM